MCRMLPGRAGIVRFVLKMCSACYHTSEIQENLEEAFYYKDPAVVHHITLVHLTSGLGQRWWHF